MIRRAPVLALLGATAALVIAMAWGRALVRDDRRIALGAAPFFGRWRWEPRWWFLVAGLLAVALVTAWPRAVQHWSWPKVLAGSWIAGMGWTLALAVGEGPADIARPLSTRFEYLAVVPGIDDLGAFWRTFLERVDGYPVHVRGHPPGTVALFWALGRLGMDGPWPAALFVVSVGASASVAVLWATRALAGEQAARAAATFVPFAPGVLWLATSTDALFAGVAAWATAAAVVATRRAGRPALVLALLSGLATGTLLLLSYGAVLFVAPVAAAIAVSRRWRIGVIVGATTLAVVLVAGAAGFWWLYGLADVRRQYADSVARFRPYEYFVFANLVVLAVAVGPATVGALARRLPRGIGLLVYATLAAVVAADLSGLSKAEVERIWLPFVPWLLLATAAVPARSRPQWLAAQFATAILLEIALRSPW